MAAFQSISQGVQAQVLPQQTMTGRLPRGGESQEGIAIRFENDPITCLLFVAPGGRWLLDTLNGPQLGKPGDYLVRDSFGNYSLWDTLVFNQSHLPL